VNLAHLIDEHAADHVAIISRGVETTYGQLRDDVARVRGGLTRLGVGPGDRVALLCGNGLYFVETYLAALGIGAVIVPLNPQSPAPEIQREIATTGVGVVLVEPVAAAAWTGVDPAAIPSVRHVIATDANGLDTELHFDDLISAEPIDIVEVDTDALATLIFTSGTAGSPRAAMLSHGNLMANIQQGRSAPGRIHADDVVYGVLPMFHIFGLNVVLGLTLDNGATLVLVQRFDPSTTLDTIRERGITVVPGAPPMWVDFSRFDEAAADSFAGVRLALTGAAKMPEEATRLLQQRFGLQLAEGYGLTEASPVVTSSAGLPLKIGSVGKVLNGVMVRVVDESGDDVLQGDSGEIWVKGANVFQGYLDDPEQTARVLTADGWLRTGDVAVTDDDGYLYLVDRAKDLIIVSGFNVYPAEVEDVISQHPAVAEVGVAGVPHPHSGEAVKAWVVVRDAMTLDEDTVITWCTERLARYKCPSKVLFVDQLPRNVSGKLLRRSLS
jgi:long-chain acyl-CoA synthetase